MNQKVEPSPGLLWTPMVPPMSSTSLRQMARPRPVPPKRRVVEESACVKGWKRCFWASGVMPMPVSRMEKTDEGVVGGLAFLLDLQLDLARLGELHRVSQQVEQNLAQARGIAHQARANAIVHHRFQADILRARARGKQGGRVGHDLADVEIDLLEVHLAGLDLGEVENVVDDGEKRIGAAFDRLGELALLPGELRIDEQVDHADDAVHGRANLVAHVGQKFALGLARHENALGHLLRLVRGGAQLVVGGG